MTKTRLEAFSDGVIAIIITIMVLELKVARTAHDWQALRPLLPVFLTYVLSFVYLGIYWNNHHHMLHATDAHQRRHPVGQPAPAVLAVAGAVRHRLDGREPLRAAARPPLYGVVLLMAAIAYTILQNRIIATQGPRLEAGAGGRPRLRRASSRRLCYVAGDSRWPSCTPWISLALYVLVALIWLVPDRRIERQLKESE